jgi:hypothetical protein
MTKYLNTSINIPFKFPRLKPLLLYLVTRGKFLHSDQFWNGLVPLCTSYPLKKVHWYILSPIYLNDAYHESQGKATYRLQSEEFKLCTGLYSNLTRERLVEKSCFRIILTTKKFNQVVISFYSIMIKCGNAVMVVK